LVVVLYSWLIVDIAEICLTDYCRNVLVYYLTSWRKFIVPAIFTTIYPNLLLWCCSSTVSGLGIQWIFCWGLRCAIAAW